MNNMKQVILKKQESDLITINETSTDKVYVARGMRDGDSRYWLLTLKTETSVLMSNGYMFQDVNSSRLGHSGRSDTVQEAIKKVLDGCYAGHMTDVYEFDNMYDAAKFFTQ